MGLFGKTPSAEEQVKKWRGVLRQEDRNIEKQIRDITLEQTKVKTAIKAAAKRGDLTNCKTLAKELTRSKKAVERLYASKATMNSVVMQLQHQMAMMKMTKTIQKSTDVMKMMGNLVKLPEIRGAMMEMQQEMMKAGMIEEMLDDAINADDDELEEETDAEVDKVLFEVTNGVMGAAPNVPSTNVKGKGKEPAVADDEEDDMEAMQARLAALSED